MSITVKDQWFHRNGISGDGYVVSRVVWTEAAAGDFVVISNVTGDARRAFATSTLALNIPYLINLS